MTELKIPYVSENWRLFIDSSKTSLKAVLLNNGNDLPSVPVAYATSMKETYDNLRKILEKISYDHHQWNVCADLKVVAILTGLQAGYTKFCCFLCEWDSRAKDQHYVRKDWPLRVNDIPGCKNIAFGALVDKKIIIPPLHIKLGLFKQFVKALNRDGKGFLYLKQKFPHISDAKIKEGVFVGPQIKQLFDDDAFSNSLSRKEKRAWESFVFVCRNFLGNKRSDDYQQRIDELLKSYKALGCNMSLKVHFLHSHLSFSRKIVEPFRTSMVKDFISRLPKWRRDTLENGTLVCWRTGVGLKFEKHRRTLTKGEKFPSRCRYVFFSDFLIA